MFENVEMFVIKCETIIICVETNLLFVGNKLNSIFEKKLNGVWMCLFFYHFFYRNFKLLLTSILYTFS